MATCRCTRWRKEFQTRGCSFDWIWLQMLWCLATDRACETASRSNSNERSIKMHCLLYLWSSAIPHLSFVTISLNWAFSKGNCSVSAPVFPYAGNRVSSFKFGRQLYIFSDIRKILFDWTISLCRNSLWFSICCFENSFGIKKIVTHRYQVSFLRWRWATCWSWLCSGMNLTLMPARV